MEAITRSSKIGRSEGECFFHETQNLNFLSFPTQSGPKSPVTNSGPNFSKKTFKFKEPVITWNVQSLMED